MMDSSGNLFGTTENGGAFVDYGTVFELAHGSGTITALASFNGSDGENPEAALIMDSSGNVYGTTYTEAPASTDGTVFELAKGSGTITTLASFNGTDGARPGGRPDHGQQRQSVRHNAFGGTGFNGFQTGDGTVFELAKGSGTITTLASFNGTNGASPDCSLMMDSSGNLYGTAGQGAPPIRAPFSRYYHTRPR